MIGWINDSCHIFVEKVDIHHWFDFEGDDQDVVVEERDGGQQLFREHFASNPGVFCIVLGEGSQAQQLMKTKKFVGGGESE